jgi:hypothetical protein
MTASPSPRLSLRVTAEFRLIGALHVTCPTDAVPGAQEEAISPVGKVVRRRVDERAVNFRYLRIACNYRLHIDHTKCYFWLQIKSRCEQRPTCDIR